MWNFADHHPYISLVIVVLLYGFINGIGSFISKILERLFLAPKLVPGELISVGYTEHDHDDDCDDERELSDDENMPEPPDDPNDIDAYNAYVNEYNARIDARTLRAKRKRTDTN